MFLEHISIKWEFYVELNAIIGVNFQTNLHEQVADRMLVYYKHLFQIFIVQINLQYFLSLKT